MGTASATWEKIRLATASTEDIEQDSGADDREQKFVEWGKNGEIFIVYPLSNIVEIWDWIPPSDEKDDVASCCGDTLYLHGQYELSIPPEPYPKQTKTKAKERGDKECLDISSIEAVQILHDAADEGHTILILTRTPALPMPYALEVHKISTDIETTIAQVLVLPEIMQESSKNLEFIIKSSKQFIIVANNEGFMFLFKLKAYKYGPGNCDLNLPTIHKTSCQPILNQYRLFTKFADEEILLKTSCFDDKPIFDIVGNWLVYSPTKYEFDHLKIISNSADKMISKSENTDLDPIATNYDKTQNIHTDTMFTPVKLPPPGPLLNRVISTLSNNAIDGFLKLSEVSSNKLKAYLNKDKETENKDDKDMVHSINAFGKSVGKVLYSTASTTVSTIHKTTMSLQPNDNQLIKIVDLSNDTIMAVFKPPGGVSNLSLSPFDLHLVQSNYRGDNFFMWDMFRLPKEISLIGKFNRGKTSAVIKEIFWFTNHYDSASIIQGNNVGFGCITKSAGSVHWFNINYLSGDSAKNFPNSLVQEGQEKPQDLQKHFLDSWVLSSINATKFIPLPNIANNINNKYKSNTKYIVNQLAILDSNNHIRLISALDGNHLFKYELPNVEVSKHVIIEKKLDEAYRMPHSSSDSGTNSIIPLSQAEIETCGPYLNLINSKNVQFSTYGFSDSKTDFEAFLQEYTEYGNDIPTREIDFNGQRPHSLGSVASYQPKEGIVVDQDEPISLKEIPTETTTHLNKDSNEPPGST